MCAASGSQRIFHSDAAVLFPRPQDPPNTKILSKESTILGERCKAIAKFVNGPVVTIVGISYTLYSKKQ